MTIIGEVLKTYNNNMDKAEIGYYDGRYYLDTYDEDIRIGSLSWYSTLEEAVKASEDKAKNYQLTINISKKRLCTAKTTKK